MNMNKSLFRETDYTYYNPYESSKSDVNFAIISDLHFAPSVSDKKLNKIINKLKNKKPNYILFPGDLIDCNDMIEDEKEKERLIKFVKELGKIAPTFMCIGNHDLIKANKERKSKDEHVWTYGYNEDFFNYLNKLNNIHVLDNEMYENEYMQIIGITQPMEYCEDPKNPKVENKKIFINTLKQNKNLLKRISDEKVTLLLTHSPVVLTDREVLPYLFKNDYIVSGHMHMGCVPFGLSWIKSNKGLIAPKKDLFPDNARGIKDITVPYTSEPYYSNCDKKIKFIVKENANIKDNTEAKQESKRIINKLVVNKKLISGPYKLDKDSKLCTGKLIVSGSLTCIQECVTFKPLHLGNLVSPMNIETLTLTKKKELNNQSKIKYHR